MLDPTLTGPLSLIAEFTLLKVSQGQDTNFMDARVSYDIIFCLE